MSTLGVADQLTGFLSGLNVPKSVLILIVCLTTIVVATPYPRRRRPWAGRRSLR